MARIRRHTSRTYTLEEKIALVTEIEQRYRAGGISLKAAAEAAGTTDTSYSNWRRAGIEPRSVAPSPPPEARAPRPYEPAERERLMAAVERLRGEGRSIQAACREVGIAVKSYRKWRDDAAPLPAMRPVDVTALVPAASAALELALPKPPAAAALTLLAPGGYRVEGLDVEGAAQLLRALR